MNSKLVAGSGLALGVLLAVSSCQEKERYRSEGLSPEKAVKSFELAAGFQIEPFAAEPNIMDPIQMVFDEQGNIYVVEMGDYPYKPEPGQGRGKIRVLFDKDGDGIIDESSVFAEHLPDATSVLPWKGGLIVTSAPNILYLKDTDGDFKADSTEVLFTGFFENNSEAQITSLRYGVDNWIYANNNGQRGEVKFNRTPDAPAVAVGGADFRFRLDKNLFEAESGAGQFGLAVDDWGNRFFTQNTLHIQTSPIPRRYLYRHSYLPSYAAVHNIYAHDLTVFQISEPPYWRVERSTRRQKQYDEAGGGRVEHIDGNFTGASGGTLYAADLFPESFYGNVFTAEVACNLVHRDVIVPTDNAPFFSARRAESETDREFLASTDPWFRPVNFTVGPDGALYVVDMYRQHIETPVSIPDDLKEDMDFLHGNQYGRIYRIFPDNMERPALPKPDLRGKPSAELVSLLTRPGQWWRLQAQRLLVERQDKSVIPDLVKLYEENQDERTRLHALYTLEGLDALTAELVKKALGDQSAQVRRHAIILAERYPETVALLAKAVNDTHPQTAFQAALSIGQFSGGAVVDALAGVVKQHHTDDWFRKAVLSSASGSSVELLQVLQRDGFFKESNGGQSAFASDLAYVVGARGNNKDNLSLFSALASQDNKEVLSFQTAVVSGFSKGVDKASLSDGDKRTLAAALNKLNNTVSGEVKTAVSGIIDKLNKK